MASPLPAPAVMETISTGSSVWQSLPTNALAVGASWMISSALLTTYSTTEFLKYQPSPSGFLEGSSQGIQQHPRKSAQSSILSGIPRPTLLTLYRFAGSLFLGLVLHPDVTKVADRLRSTLQLVPDFFLPAFFLFVANLTNSISLDRIGISLTYTSKCGIPLITVLMTLLLDGYQAMPNAWAMLSLLPIAAGIAAASWQAPAFDTLGFVAAIVSTTAQSALNVTAKKALTKTAKTGLEAQRVMVTVGLALSIVMTLARSWRQILIHKSEHENDGSAVAATATSAPSVPPVWLALLAAAAYHIEYVLSFMFVKLVHPVSYGASDAVRRLAIILAGRAMFGGAPLKTINVIGIALALIGAVCYSIAS